MKTRQIAKKKEVATTGRPAFFDTPDEFQKMCDGYFKYCEKNDKPPTITGLAFFLGFESRQSFYDYEKREIYSYTVKRNRLRIESEYESRLSMHNPTGAIFALKNLGWSDRQETHLVVSNELTEEQLQQRLIELDETMKELED